MIPKLCQLSTYLPSMIELDFKGTNRQGTQNLYSNSDHLGIRNHPVHHITSGMHGPTQMMSPRSMSNRETQVGWLKSVLTVDKSQQYRNHIDKTHGSDLGPLRDYLA